MDDNVENGYARLEKLILNFQAQTDARFEATDARLDKMDARFDKMDAKFETIDDRLDKMEEGIASLRSSVDDLRTAQAASEYAMNKRLDALFDDREIQKEMVRESYRILKKFELRFEQDESERVAVDVVINDHEKRIDALERKAM